MAPDEFEYFINRIGSKLQKYDTYLRLAIAIIRIDSNDSKQKNYAYLVHINCVPKRSVTSAVTQKSHFYALSTRYIGTEHLCSF